MPFADRVFGGGGARALGVGGEGLKVPPPFFICEKNRKSNNLMPCVEIFLSGSFDDKVIFQVSQLSYDGEGGALGIFTYAMSIVKRPTPPLLEII